MKNKVFIYTLIVVLLLGAGAYMWLWPFSVMPNMVGNDEEQNEEAKRLEEKKDIFRNDIESNNQDEVRDKNVEYSELYTLRGLKLEKPNLEMVEKKLPKVNGSITIKGSFSDLYLLDSYAVTVRIKYTEIESGNFKNYNFKVSENGEFEENISLGSHAGEHKITILAPEIQHSYDDVAIAEVVSFYIINE